MESIIISPAEIKALGDPRDAHFCLITNATIQDRLEITEHSGYLTQQKIIFERGQSFEALLKEKVPERAHVLVISPDVFFQSPPQEVIGAGRKLMAMACNSTPTDLEAIRHFLDVIKRTDPEKQQAFADRFFALGEQAEYLEFVDEKNKTRARFKHLDESYLWSEQAGTLGYGEQQLAPAGEISVLPLRIQDFDESLRLDFNGTIALNGHPILHSGTPHFLRADQKRVHAQLNAMSEDAVIAEVRNGAIADMHAGSSKSEAARAMLQSMFDVDSRYRILWEIGFGVNTENRIFPGNHAMNETHGGTAGAIHFGLGLTPYTQYHLDIVCPNTAVLTDKGDSLINPRKKALNRQKTSGCVCVEA